MLHGSYMVKRDEPGKIANIPPFGLRLQPDLKRQVEEAAKANGRSLNAEITHRLEASFREDAGHTSFAWAKTAKGSNASDPVQIQIEDLQRRVRKLEGDR